MSAELSAKSPIGLPDPDRIVRIRHHFDDRQVLAIRAALAANRPLLVRGEPGTGKSQLARAAAAALGRAFVYTAVDGRTEPRDLLWTVDLVARLAEAQILRHVEPAEREEGDASEKGSDDPRKLLAIDRFVRPGPVWWAFDWTGAGNVGDGAIGVSCSHDAPEKWTPEKGCVVLIDEIDKADPTVPNALLDAFGHGRFQTPSGATVVRSGAVDPLVVITTNEERALPDAFVRRCLVLTLAFPERDRLLSIGALHQPGLDETLRERAAALLLEHRGQRDLGPYKPGLAEYLDLLRVLAGPLPPGVERAADLLELVAGFALSKNPPKREGA